MSLGLITILEEVAGGGTGVSRTLRCSIVGDDSYPTSGTVLFEALFQAATLAAGIKGSVKGATVVAVQMEQGFNGVIQDFDLHYDHINDKLMATVRSTAAQVANAVDMSGTPFGVLITVK